MNKKDRIFCSYITAPSGRGIGQNVTGLDVGGGGSKTQKSVTQFMNAPLPFEQKQPFSF